MMANPEKEITMLARRFLVTVDFIIGGRFYNISANDLITVCELLIDGCSGPTRLNSQ